MKEITTVLIGSGIAVLAMFIIASVINSLELESFPAALALVLIGLFLSFLFGTIYVTKALLEDKI